MRILPRHTPWPCSLRGKYIASSPNKEKQDTPTDNRRYRAIHAEYNPDCEDAVFVAAFNNQDPGVEQVAQAFFNLRSDIVQSTLNGVSMLNGEDIESFRDALPANIVQGVETCLAKCGIAKKAKRDLADVLAAREAEAPTSNSLPQAS